MINPDHAAIRVVIELEVDRYRIAELCRLDLGILYFQRPFRAQRDVASLNLQRPRGNAAGSLERANLDHLLQVPE